MPRRWGILVSVLAAIELSKSDDGGVALIAPRLKVRTGEITGHTTASPGGEPLLACPVAGLPRTSGASGVGRGEAGKRETPKPPLPDEPASRPDPPAANEFWSH